MDHISQDGHVFAYGLAVAAGQVALVTLLRSRSTLRGDGIMWRKAFHMVVLSVFFPVRHQGIGAFTFTHIPWKSL